MIASNTCQRCWSSPRGRCYRPLCSCVTGGMFCLLLILIYMRRNFKLLFIVLEARCCSPPSLSGSLFSSSPWPPRAGFTCQRRFRPEQKTRPLTASPGVRLPWQRRPRGQAASNHSCWIRLVRALMLGAQTQRHPAGAEPGLQLPRSALPSGAQALPALRRGPRSPRRRLSQGLWPQHVSILWPADPPPRQGSLPISQAWSILA